jgi:phytoene dehydrogenase-like protein
MDAIEFAYDDAKYGGCPRTAGDGGAAAEPAQPDLAPEGQHVLAANVMYVPAAPKGGWTGRAQRSRSASWRLLERHAPGIGDLVLHSRAADPRGPRGASTGVTGGHWHHAEPPSTSC